MNWIQYDYFVYIYTCSWYSGSLYVIMVILFFGFYDKFIKNLDTQIGLVFSMEPKINQIQTKDKLKVSWRDWSFGFLCKLFFDKFIFGLNYFITKRENCVCCQQITNYIVGLLFPLKICFRTYLDKNSLIVFIVDELKKLIEKKWRSTKYQAKLKSTELKSSQVTIKNLYTFSIIFVDCSSKLDWKLLSLSEEGFRAVRGMMENIQQ